MNYYFQTHVIGALISSVYIQINRTLVGLNIKSQSHLVLHYLLLYLVSFQLLVFQLQIKPLISLRVSTLIFCGKNICSTY